MKLAASGTKFASGAAIVTPNIIRAELIAQYSTLETNGFVQDSTGFASGLIVEQNSSNPNRVDVLWPGVLITRCACLRCSTNSACRRRHKGLLNDRYNQPPGGDRDRHR
ncbi:hypothetical protein [Pantoea stewartii]|uniref:hypothetical protein n=1 Tax=Pantoea stewartii TaxID=66269 RepID=UPI0036271275